MHHPQTALNSSTSVAGIVVAIVVMFASCAVAGWVLYSQTGAAAIMALAALAMVGVISLLVASLFVRRLLTQLANAEAESHQRAIEAETATVRINAVLSSLSEGVYQLDIDGLLNYINPAGEGILGYRSSEIMRKNMHDLIHYKLPDGTLRPSESCALLSVLQDGVRYETREEYFVHKNGTFIPVQCSSSPLIAQGKVIGAVVSFKDVSERHAVERRISEFYSTVSHELRTPLTSIRAAFGLMEGGAAGMLSERATKLVKLGNQESQRLMRLINDILDMKKLEYGKLELHQTDVPIDSLISETLASMQVCAADENILLKCESQLTGLSVFCDRDRIVQVLTNLVDNAIKFSPPASTVTMAVSATDHPDEVEFVVSDRGPGIAAEQCSQLFHMFHQLDSSDSRAKGGTGLGLAISKAIVEQHGGRIGVRSTAGEGSTFWFTLPLPGPGRCALLQDPNAEDSR